MPNNWIKVLKEYNKDNKNEWCVPKKGSEAYNKLKKKQKYLDNPNLPATKIQVLVKGVQFRSKELPKLVYAEELKKSNLKANPYYLLENPEEAVTQIKKTKAKKEEAKKKYLELTKGLQPKLNLSYAEVIARPKVENIEYLKRQIAEERKQASIKKYSNLKINYLM